MCFVFVLDFNNGEKKETLEQNLTLIWWLNIYSEWIVKACLVNYFITVYVTYLLIKMSLFREKRKSCVLDWWLHSNISGRHGLFIYIMHVIVSSVSLPNTELSGALARKDSELKRTSCAMYVVRYSESRPELILYNIMEIHTVMCSQYIMLTTLFLTK